MTVSGSLSHAYSATAEEEEEEEEEQGDVFAVSAFFLVVVRYNFGTVQSSSPLSCEISEPYSLR